MTLKPVGLIIRTTQGTLENHKSPGPTLSPPNQNLWRKGQPRILCFYKALCYMLMISHFGKPAKLKPKEDLETASSPSAQVMSTWEGSS